MNSELDIKIAFRELLHSIVTNGGPDIDIQYYEDNGFNTRKYSIIVTVPEAKYDKMKEE